jgi:DNA polymerase-3 subunit beta
VKVTIPRETLISALADVSPVVPSRTPQELLRNVLLTVIGGTATLIATDQEVGIRREIKDTTAERDGSVILPPARLTAILREVTHDTVTLDIGQSSVTILSGGSRFTLSTVDANEFPEVARFKESAYITIKASALKRLISRVLFAADTESTRYALGGIAVDYSHATKSLALVTTDGRRLAIAVAFAGTVGTLDVMTPTNLPVIPMKAAIALSKALPDTDAEVWLALGVNSVLAKCEGITVYGRLIEGRFPQYMAVIPTDSTTTVTAVCGPLYSAVRQAMVTLNEESRGAGFAFADGNLKITSNAAEVGDSEISIPVQIDGPELDTTFDPKYLGQFLAQCDRSFQITGRFTDGDSAALYSCGEDYRYVVMPLARD